MSKRTFKWKCINDHHFIFNNSVVLISDGTLIGRTVKVTKDKSWIFVLDKVEYNLTKLLAATFLGVEYEDIATFNYKDGNYKNLRVSNLTINLKRKK